MNLRLIAMTVLLALAGGFAVRSYFNSDDVFVPFDAVEYWGAGTALVRGENPYDPPKLLEIQREAIPKTKQALMFWTPPWSLGVVAPLGWLGFKAAVLVWIALQIGLLVASAVLFAKSQPGLTISECLGCVALFAPVYCLLAWGQFGGVVLFGLSLFHWGVRKDRVLPAGVGFALAAIKPHLILLVGLGVVLAATRERRYLKIGLVSISSLLALAAIASLFRTSIVSDYIDAMGSGSGSAHTGLSDWILPTLGYWLRQTVDPGNFRLQFIPAALLGIVFLELFISGRWKPHIEQMPTGIVLSLLAAPYGAWIFDLVLLLIPLWALLPTWKGMSAIKRSVFVSLFALCQVAVPVLGRYLEMEAVWYPLAFASLYFATRHFAKTKAA